MESKSKDDKFVVAMMKNECLVGHLPEKSVRFTKTSDRVTVTFELK